MPTRAFRYCEPMRLASAMGWYVFPPLDMDLLFDGVAVYWRLAHDTAWEKLEAIQYPNFSEQFDEICPEDLRGFSPPLAGTSPEPDIVQFWSGLAAKTLPGWSVVLRAPPNFPSREQYSCYEGVIETERWFGPLFTNIRFNKTDVPICLRRDWPMLFVQLVPNQLLQLQLYQSPPTVDCLADFTKDDWERYRQSIVENVKRPEKKGVYATESRKARRSGLE